MLLSLLWREFEGVCGILGADGLNVLRTDDKALGVKGQLAAVAASPCSALLPSIVHKSANFA